MFNQIKPTVPNHRDKTKKRGILETGSILAAHLYIEQQKYYYQKSIELN